MQSIAKVHIICSECGTEWDELVNADSGISKESVHCPNHDSEQCGATDTYLRNLDYTLIKIIEITEI